MQSVASRRRDMGWARWATRRASRLFPLGVALLIAFPLQTGARTAVPGSPRQEATPADLARYRTFRDDVIGYVRAAAAGHFRGGRPPAFADPQLDAAGQWSVAVTAYRDGETRGSGRGSGKRLSEALFQATLSAMTPAAGRPLKAQELKDTRFLVTFHYPPRRRASIIGYRGRGLEWMGDVVPLYRMDKAAIVAHLQHAKRYLLRIMDPVHHGFAKFYDARRDVPESRLRTVFTASSLYTLLKLDAWQPDPAIDRVITPIADFILSMQCTAAPCRGGFYYSYDPRTDTREQRLVVGTASKTIFTLLDLWRRTQKQRYLEAATRAGDWLLGMQNSDGSMNAFLQRKDGKWIRNRRFSLLYNGQVLSALSRLGAATHDGRYRRAAGRIAALFMKKIEQEGDLLGDEYRTPNSVSTSWVARSLLDYSRVDPDPRLHRAVYETFDAILKRQVDDPFEPYTYGSFYDDPTTSGSGWINEVLVDVYRLCVADSRSDCGKYKEAMDRDSRWLLQRTYDAANSFALKNPARADGGAIKYYMVEAVRTDAVCHGTNSLLGLLEISGGDIRLGLPRLPFDRYLEEIRRGFAP